MDKIVECVPNFSEGRRKDVIDAISDAIKNTDGCVLLDVDPGESTNRTVYTFVGSPQSCVEGAMAAAHVAYKLINMATQHGEHPRIGAMDVCPFIPVRNVSMEECVELSKQFAQRLSDELAVSVYLYANSQPNKKRSELPDIRKGEYEALPEKLRDPEMQPDFGAADFVPSWGATCVGAREFLIAFNVNVLGTKEQAHRIALNVREQGRSDREPGRLKAVRAIGWWLDEENVAQISINLINYKVTNMHQVFEECDKDARKIKIGLCGSQIVGIIPLDALLDVAQYYIDKEQLLVLEEDQKIKLAIQRLGLGSLGPFNPRERVIEYLIEDKIGSKKTKDLKSLSVSEFVASCGARTVAPGGGCVAALVASLGSSLTCMSSLLSYGNRKFEKVDSQIRPIIPPLYKAYHELVDLIDQDAAAFNSYVSALKMNGNTEEDKVLKKLKIEEALIRCVEVPLSVAHKASSVWQHLYDLVPIFNVEAKSDFMVGVKCIETGIYGAALNVLTNLKSFDDTLKEKAELYRKTIEKINSESKMHCESLIKMLEERQ